LPTIARELSLTTVALLLGVPESDWPRFFSWTDVAMGYEDRDTGVATGRSQQVLADMFNYGVELLAAKRAAPPTDDLLSVIAHGQLAGDEKPLTEFERQANFNLLSLAGSEPPRGALSIGMLALAEHADQWEALRADRSLLDGAVEEILRWASPTPYNRRTVTRDTELRGTPLRAGEKVTLWWASANRDESVFTDPFTFDVRRDPNPHVAFGMGGHTCLGEQLGRIQMRIMLEALLDHAERIEPTAPARWARNNKHIVALSVPVAFTPAG
jgi:cytochrome P450